MDTDIILKQKNAKKTIKQLREEISHLNKEITGLQEENISEQLYCGIFEQSSDGLVLIDKKTGGILEFNDSAHKNLGYTRKEFKRLGLQGLGVLKSPTEKKSHLGKVQINGLTVFETKHRHKDGRIKNILTRSKPLTISDKQVFLSVWIDITEQKLSGQLLRRSLEELKYRINELQVLLKQRENKKIKIKKDIMYNLDQQFSPYLIKLINGCKNPEQKKYLKRITLNLNKLANPLSSDLSFKNMALTPSENQIANFIIYNRSSKEIANIMNISTGTVHFHRKNIRKKLNIQNPRISLRDHLLASHE